MTEKGVDFESVHYLDETLTASELKRLLRSAGLKPQDALRKNEPAYKVHVMGRDLRDEKLIDLMVKFPELIQRPFVISGDKAVLARPVEKLSELKLR